MRAVVIVACVGLWGCSGEEGSTADDDPEPPSAPASENDVDAASGMTPDEGAATSGSAGSPPVPGGSEECWQGTNGSRLLLIGWNGEDGSWETSNQWFDTELETRCSFVIAGDGVTRCLPTNSSIYTEGQVFIDAECTESRPMRSPQDCFPGPDVRYYREILPSDDPACSESIVRLFELRASLGAVDPIYVAQGEGSCTEFIAASAGEHEVFEIGDEVPPESFVAVQGYESRGDRLRVPLAVRSDGSTEFATLDPYDVEIDSRCSFRLATDGSLRCLPYFSGGIRYLDAACSERGAEDWSYGDACRDPDAADLGAPWRPYARESVDECGTARVYELPPPEEVPELDTVYSLDDSDSAMCMANPLTKPARYLPLQGEAAPDQFALGSMELVDCGPSRTSGTRLQAIDFVWEDGYQTSQSFFDSQLQQRCYIGDAADGRSRCLPGFRGSLAGNQFLDAECTQAFARVPPPCLEAPDPFAGEDFVQFPLPELGDRPCTTRANGVRRLLGPYLELSLVYTLESDGTCTATPLPVPVLAREVGEEVSPTMFVAFSPSQALRRSAPP